MLKRKPQTSKGPGAWGPFLKSLNNKWGGKVTVVYIQDRGFNSFPDNNMTKISINKTKWSCLLAKTCTLILPIFFIFDEGPEKLLGLSKERPKGLGISLWLLCMQTLATSIGN